MKPKHLFLFLLLLLPVLIFLFLKSFGNNQFDIPIYYEEGLSDTLMENCDRNQAVPYLVVHELTDVPVHTIFHFENASTPLLKGRLEALERVQDVFWNNGKVRLVTLLNEGSIQQDELLGYADRVEIQRGFWNISGMDTTEWPVFKYCDLVMSDLDNRVVLVDATRRIRGYYNIMEREETDRLILELKILLTEK